MKHVKAKKKNRHKGYVKIIHEAQLRGLPLRHQPSSVIRTRVSMDWFASLVWIRIPLLLLGVVGALGLLAKYNNRFAALTRMIQWPTTQTSYVLLGISGFVFTLLVLERLMLLLDRFIQSPVDQQRTNWRCR